MVNLWEGRVMRLRSRINFIAQYSSLNIHRSIPSYQESAFALN
jgi:hypothetical protein